MMEILLTCIIGIVVGAIDVLPMIKMRLDKYSIISAYVFYFILPFVIFNIDLYGITWWLKGSIAVSYTHLDVYKRQAYSIILKSLYPSPNAMTSS